jgi:4-amino-4-deoxy-L-arabinose transferase-like glycosyltransferase
VNVRRLGHVWPDAIALAAISLTFIATSTFYSRSIPMFEGPDEIWHAIYAQAIAMGELPIQPPPAARTDLFVQREAAQPPLYYALAAPAFLGTTLDSMRASVVPNPHGSLGGPDSVDNKGLFAHRPGGDAFEPVIRRARLVSMALSLGTVLLTYYLAFVAFPTRLDVRILAATMVATLPGFLFASALVSNDSATTFFSTAVLAGLAAPAFLRSRRLHIAIGVAVGAAALAKSSGLVAIPLVAVAALLRVDPPTRTRLRTVALVAAIALAAAGWWYVCNLVLYGELTAMRALLGRAELFDQMPSARDILNDLPGLHASFIGLFGWISIRMSPIAYRGYDALFIVGALGLAVMGLKWLAAHGRVNVPIALCIVWTIAVVAALLYSRLIFLSFHGRLLYPALPAMAVLCAAGVAQLVGPAVRTWVAAALCVTLAVAAAIAPRSISGRPMPRQPPNHGALMHLPPLRPELLRSNSSVHARTRPMPDPATRGQSTCAGTSTPVRATPGASSRRSSMPAAACSGSTTAFPVAGRMRPSGGRRAVGTRIGIRFRSRGTPMHHSSPRFGPGSIGSRTAGGSMFSRAIASAITRSPAVCASCQPSTWRWARAGRSVPRLPTARALLR